MSVRTARPPLSRAKFAAFLVFALSLLALFSVLVALDRAPRGAPDLLVPLVRSNSACTTDITTTLAPDNRRLCDPVAVTTTFASACPVCPEGLNVVVIQDDTPYPDWQKTVSLQTLDELERYARNGKPISIGVIHYNGQGIRKALKPTLNLSAARGPLTSFRVAHDPRALFEEAAKAGVQMIRDGRRLHGGQTMRECEFVIFFVYTKVYMEDKGEEMIRAGRLILREVPNLYVGCPHQHPEECTIWEPRVPESQRYYTEDPEAGKLRNMVRQGLRDIDTVGIVSIRNMTTDQWLPAGLSIVPDSFNVAPQEMVREGDKTKVTWTWRAPKPAETITLTFQAKPSTAGLWQSELRSSWTDSEDRRGERKVVSQPLTVLDDDCSTPTAVPTPTGRPTPTDTPVPIVTATATATDVPTATPTPRPKPIYLPGLLREECRPGEVHADVVLVLDISTSMDRPTRSGGTKIAATQNAAREFVQLMDLAADARGAHDQVGIVGFNRDAWIEAPLGSSKARILAAIDALPLRRAEYTRLDRALIVGAQAILEGPTRKGNTPVLILLTDGLPNQVPPAEDGTMETTVLRAAAAAKKAGIVVYTIAIGAPTDTSPELMTACATDASHYYYTPDAEDLAAIYQAIAHSIDCPREQFWGRR